MAEGKMQLQDIPTERIAGYVSVLASLAKAPDTSALQRTHRGVAEHRDLLFELCKKEPALLDATSGRRLVQLLFAAASNCLATLVAEAGSAVLAQHIALEVARTLCAEVEILISNHVDNKRSSTEGLQLFQVGAKEYLFALIAFTESAVSSLQRLAAQPNRSQESQQSKPAAKDHVVVQQCQGYFAAVPLFAVLHKGWQTILSHFAVDLQKEGLLMPAIAAAARLSVITVPCLGKVQASTLDCTSTSHIPMVLKLALDYPTHASHLTHRSLQLSGALLMVMGTHTSDYQQAVDGPQQQLQSLRQIQKLLSTEHLYHAMLIGLLCQALALCYLLEEQGESAAATAVQQQRDGGPDAASMQPQSPEQQKRVPHSLKTLSDCLHRLGLYSAWQPRVKDKAVLVYNKNHCSGGMTLLASLLACHRKPHASSSSTAGQKGQQHDCLQGRSLPHHLVQTVIKLLTEIMVLVPSSDTGVLISSLDLMLELLRESAAASSSPNTAGEQCPSPWPVLPAAVAAGLLHPVVQLLSRAVIRAMGEVEPQQQQQQQQRQHEEHQQQKQQRYLFSHGPQLLLSRFSDLLISVCQAVEPKHIAAALRSDPVIPLVAIEAVIRAQACCLAPDSSSKKQKGTTAAAAADTSTVSSVSGVLLDDTVHSEDQAAALLLPFVYKVILALRELVQIKQLSDLIDGEVQPDSSQGVSDLAVRLFTTASTALKLVQAATAYVRQSNAAHIAAIITGVVSGIDVMKQTVFAMAAAPRQNPPGWFPFDAWLGVPYAAVQLALRFDDVVRASGRSTVHLSNLPISLLLQTMSVWGDALSAARQVIEHYTRQEVHSRLPERILSRLHDLDPRTVNPNYAVVVDGIVASATLQLVLPVSAGMRSLNEAVPSMTIWPCLNAVATNGMQLPKQWVQQVLSYRACLLGDCMQLQGCAQLTQYQCMGAVAACTNAIGMQVNIPIGTSGAAAVRERGFGSYLDAAEKADDGDGYVVKYKVSCESQQWHSHVRILCEELHNAAVDACVLFPVPFRCNNPSCVNLSKLSEYQLMSGEACVCGGCKVARYCGRECQKKHWKQHKQVCKLLE